MRRLRKIALTSALMLLALLSGPTLAAASCREPATGTKNVPLFSPPISEVVIGAGRLQFYSAPSDACAMPGVFVIPKDQLIAYAQSGDGWTSVMYTNPKTGDFVTGWVRSARLKQTGTVGPR
jgi:hypothetical protein